MGRFNNVTATTSLTSGVRIYFLIWLLSALMVGYTELPTQSVENQWVISDTEGHFRLEAAASDRTGDAGL